jgi:hypothetical protein
MINAKVNVENTFLKPRLMANHRDLPTFAIKAFEKPTSTYLMEKKATRHSIDL